MINSNIIETNFNSERNVESNNPLYKNEFNSNSSGLETKSFFKKPKDFLENLAENYEKSKLEINPYHRSFSLARAQNEESIISSNGKLSLI